MEHKPYCIVDDGTDCPYIFETEDSMFNECGELVKLPDDVEENQKQLCVDWLKDKLGEEKYLFVLDFLNEYMQDEYSVLDVYLFDNEDIKEYNNSIIEKNFDGVISNNNIAEWLLDPRDCPGPGGLHRCDFMQFIKDTKECVKSIHVASIIKRIDPEMYEAIYANAEAELEASDE